MRGKGGGGPDLRTEERRGGDGFGHELSRQILLKILWILNPLDTSLRFCLGESLTCVQEPKTSLGGSLKENFRRASVRCFGLVRTCGSQTDSFIGFFIDSFNNSFIESFIESFIKSFIGSFMEFSTESFKEIGTE